jgi:Uma2 family endonuclease
MTTTDDTVEQDQVIYLENVSWDTYLSLRQDTQEQHVFITYDNGRTMIDRRGAPVGALENVSWATYLRLLEDLQSQRLQLTYDNGRLEIVSPTHRHDRIKSLIGRMIEGMALELSIPITCFGSATWRGSNSLKGLEADECYYIQREALVRGKDQINLDEDPPPDLAVEVEITHHDIDRLAVYASIRVPEVWHFRREKIRCLALQQGGLYSAVEASLAFPFLRPTELDRFLAMRHGTDETSLIRQFNEWVRTLR